MSEIAVPLLYAMAKSCSGSDNPHLTLATAEDGTRYAAWSYGAVRLPRDVLRGVPDGQWRLFASGEICHYENDRAVTPGLVRTQLLPLLGQVRPTAVHESPWMLQAGYGVQRLLDRSDGSAAVVNQAFWACWSQVSPLPIWQLGGPSKPLVWAKDKTARGEAVLLPIWKGADVRVPLIYQGAAAMASEGGPNE
ncbi:hypothetical protein AB0395_47115 [Streptosporangium sp. NPDC051023]|uniref:hypothetical protein n=1 Tax=Streptosporangium sp. NPDC051023 TaxID=3155410 RepID=UPI00344C03F7